MHISFDLSILFLRIGIAYLYIYAAYAYSKDKESFGLALESTKSLFISKKDGGENIGLVKLFTYLGIVIMYIGGLSILIGIEARVGALLLLIFTIGGTIIHSRLKKEAEEIILRSPKDSEMTKIANSANSAHFAGVVKDVCLISVLIFIILNGVGKYQICDLLQISFTVF